MRLHRLSLTGVGPFRERQEIDFDDLTSSGLFLIEGPTGSGKTTIIDAVVYALFGVVSAGDDEATRLRIRSQFSTETDPTGVECEFSVDGRRFRISRVPAGFRDPADPGRKARSRGPLQTLTEYRPGGEPIIRTQRREVAERISEVLGMSVDQFRQLVVLPQGRFAELLRQTPAERLRSLEPLLESGLMAAVQSDLEQRGQEARRELAHADSIVTGASEQLHGRLAAWLEQMSPEVEFNDPEVPDDVRCARVDDILAALEADAARTATARDEQAVVTESHRRAADQAAEAWSRLDAVQRASAAVSEARSAADPDDAALDDAGAQARLTQLHRLTGSLTAHAAWENMAADRRAEVDALRQRAADLRHRIDQLEQERAPLPAELERLERDRDQATARAARLGSLRAEEARLLELEGKASDRERVGAEEAALQEAETQAITAVTNLEQRERGAAAALMDMLHQQRAAAAVSLASLLSTGDPCPVCGSTDHPSPARGRQDGGPVSDEEITSAQERLDSARESADAGRAAAEAARAELRAKQQELAVLVGALGELDVAAIGVQLAETSRQRADAEAAESLVERLDRSIAETRGRADQLRDQQQDARTQVVEIDSTIESRTDAEQQRLAEIRLLIGEAESAVALLTSATDRITRLDNLSLALGALATAQSRLPAELADVSPAAAAASSDERAAERDAAEELLAGLTSQAATSTAIWEESRPLARQLRDAINERARVRESAQVPLQLAALVTANNRLRLQLRSYALQRRFASVLIAASHHLERMSAGKFSFSPSDTTAGSGQSGLGITLLDSWTGQTQEPKSLSGGETFYASLALALGLADVVRGEAGGSALETLFVDEGFGSLDQDTLSQVLDQLDALRAGNRVVGVVSHVTEMKETIPDRLEVRRQEDRTSLIQRDRA